MAGKGSKWLIGCGIGCGVVVLAVVGIGITFGLFLKQTFHGIGVAEESYQELVARHGQVEAFVPASDGSIPAERMERFLSVRDALAESRAGLETMFEGFRPDEMIEGEPSVGEVLRVIRGFAGMINPVANHVDERHRALIDAEMGLGEYVYIYCIAYYSALGHPPEDGPVIAEGDDHGDRLFGDGDSTFGPGKVRRRYRRYMLAILRNQLESLPAEGTDGDADRWRGTLSEEIGRFKSNPGRAAWQDGLPPAIQASLAPYLDRLEATYSPAVNCFELPPHDDEDWGKWS